MNNKYMNKYMNNNLITILDAKLFLRERKRRLFINRLDMNANGFNKLISLGRKLDRIGVLINKGKNDFINQCKDDFINLRTHCKDDFINLRTHCKDDFINVFDKINKTAGRMLRRSI
jgi:hypothetical protein